MAQEITMLKMNGLGNDFLIYDEQRLGEHQFTIEQIKNFSDRNNQNTNGCDQFIVLKKSKNADGFMQIYNADGSEVSACGNATRCIAHILFEQLKTDYVVIETLADKLAANKISDKLVEVNMGQPNFGWQQIPLSRDVDIDALPILVEGLGVKPMAVSIGNPHMVFFLEQKIADININKFGSDLETHKLFPEHANVSFANIIDENNIALRVFERGVGETLACGTGACATAVCAIKSARTGTKVNVQMQGGKLQIEWRGGINDNIFMTGDIEYEGEIKVVI